MTKEHLRKLYKEKRKALTDIEKLKLDDLMLIHFQLLPLDVPAHIMSYVPFEKMNEFDPQTIIDYCYFKNQHQQLFYPVVNPNSDEMKCVLVDDNSTFEPNKYGILEPVNAVTISPEELDWVLMPLLCFDVIGHRVGYGKGYYDRFLNLCREDVIKIGFSYFDAIPLIEDSNYLDVKLDYCVTPTRMYQF